MKTTAWMLVCAVLVCAAGCRRMDERVFTVSIPSLTERHAPAIAAALKGYAGIDPASLSFDYAAKTLTLRYDSMQLAKKNIEHSIARAGFAANDVTPESVGVAPRAP